MGVDAQMLVKTHSKLTDKQLREISVKMTEAFGPSKFFLDEERNRHALEFVQVYEQDGDDILPATDETFINVNLSGRYYGPGYERGNPIGYVMIASFLESAIPQSTIWYGGDSSGICATPFDQPARAKLIQHFFKHGHAPYRGYFDVLSNAEVGCAFCGIAMYNSGGGGGDSYYSCGGCGKRAIRLTNGEIHILTWEDKDFFEAHKRVTGRV